MSEIIVKLTDSRIKLKGGEYVRDLVRCKDCKFRDTMPEYEYDDDHEYRTLMGTDFCRWWDDESPNDDDYCSFGEREKE